MTWTPDGRPVVRRGRNPIEIALLAVLLVSSIYGVFDPAKAAPTMSTLLGSWAWVWHFGVLIGCITALVSTTLRPLTDVLIERIGMVWLSSLFLAYGVAIAIVTGYSTAAVLVAGLGLGFGLRAWQITKDLRKLSGVLQELPDSAATPPE